MNERIVTLYGKLTNGVFKALLVATINVHKMRPNVVKMRPNVVKSLNIRSICPSVKNKYNRAQRSQESLLLYIPTKLINSDGEKLLNQRNKYRRRRGKLSFRSDQTSPTVKLSPQINLLPFHQCTYRHINLYAVFTPISTPSNKRCIRNRKVNKHRGPDVALIRGIPYNLETSTKQL